MALLLNVLNMLLSTAMWFILGRLVLALFIRNEKNAVWQLFVLVTEPLYLVSRLLTGNRLPEGWLPAFSLLWLLALRLLVVALYPEIEVPPPVRP